MAKPSGAFTLVSFDQSSSIRRMIERLSRLDRIFERTPVYFVTACTLERRKILASPEVHDRLQRFARDGAAHGAWLGAYVLMPDHFHAFVALSPGDHHRRALEVGDWMKSLKATLSQLLREHGLEGPYWQKGFFDHVLRSEESFAEN